MPRLPLLLRSAPLFVSANSSQLISDANVGINGDVPMSMFVFARILSVPAAGTIMCMGTTGGSHTGVQLRVLSATQIDVNIAGIGSIPATLESTLDRYFSIGVSKAAGSNPYLLWYNGTVLNGGGTGAGNFVDAPVRFGVNQAGANRLDGQLAVGGIWRDELSAADFRSLHRFAGQQATQMIPRAFYFMSDSRGGKVRDSSPNANDATPTALQPIGGAVPYGVRALVKYESVLQVPGALHVFKVDSDTVTQDGSNRVSQINDLTGNGAHLVQATGALQPLYVASGINGRPAVRLTSAADEFMAATNGLFRGAARPHTLVCVVKAESSGNSAFTGFFTIGSGGVGGNSSTLGHDNGNKLWFGGAGYGTPIIDNAAFTNGQTYVMVKRSNGIMDKLYLNGKFRGEAKQFGAYTITPIGDMLLGKYTSTYTGEDFLMSFCGVWNRELSDGEVRGLMNTLMAEYGGGTPSARAIASGRGIAYRAPIAGAYATGTITVNDYSELAGAPATGSFTVTDFNNLVGSSFDLFGMATLAEGADFTAATSNNATALSIANAINTAAGEDVTDVVGGTVTITVPGGMDGSELVWTVPMGGGVTPTTVTMTGGVAVTDLHLAGGFQPFGTDPGLIDPGTSNDECADNIAAWINGGGACSAVAVGNVVTITSLAVGTAGNAYDLSQQPRDGIGTPSYGLTLSGAFLSGGVDAVSASGRAIAT